MKCLSLWEPWATLLVAGEKKIETRSWPWRGDLPAVLAIHAAKRFTPEQRMLCEREPFHSALRRAGWYERPIPSGVVIGLVRLVECVGTALTTLGRWPMSPTDYPPPTLAGKYLETFPDERHFGDYSGGRYAWTCDRFGRFVEPYPCVGRQSVFEWHAPRGVEEAARLVMTRLPEEAVFAIDV
jgi:hypothetical protein